MRLTSTDGGLVWPDGAPTSSLRRPDTGLTRPHGNRAWSQGEANLSAEQSQAGEEPRVPPPHVDPGRPRHHQGPPPPGPSPAGGLIWRIRDRETFLALRRSRRRVRRGPVTVTFVPSDTPAPPRVAYAVSRGVGRAVERNRLRRRLRAVVFEAREHLAPGAYLVGATGGAAALSSGELREIVSEALQAVVREPG